MMAPKKNIRSSKFNSRRDSLNSIASSQKIHLLNEPNEGEPHTIPDGILMLKEPEPDALLNTI